ncbi:hypothetical protein QE152_g30697 [Popillia japonica]|uniref:Uncharacterized protein n=1 Tax=Popillia japonica TaxID=7064 RepID=A0AAW1JEX4_POPJA
MKQEKKINKFESVEVVARFESVDATAIEEWLVCENREPKYEVKDDQSSFNATLQLCDNVHVYVHLRAGNHNKFVEEFEKHKNILAIYHRYVAFPYSCMKSCRHY